MFGALGFGLKFQGFRVWVWASGLDERFGLLGASGLVVACPCPPTNHGLGVGVTWGMTYFP